MNPQKDRKLTERARLECQQLPLAASSRQRTPSFSLPDGQCDVPFSRRQTFTRAISSHRTTNNRKTHRQRRDRAHNTANNQRQNERTQHAHQNLSCYCAHKEPQTMSSRIRIRIVQPTWKPDHFDDRFRRARRRENDAQQNATRGANLCQQE